MVKMTKFQTSSFRIGSLEGAILYRLILVSFSVLLSIFFLRTYGLIALVLIPMFLLRIQHDYIDEFVVKKVRGITAFVIHPLKTEKSAYYEIFGSNYGLSDQQDRNIVYVWESIIGTFSEDLTIIRHPYKIPLQGFLKGDDEYNSLFSKSDSFADAYFVKINKTKTDDFEKILGNYGVQFSKLSEEEVGVLDVQL